MASSVNLRGSRKDGSRSRADGKDGVRSRSSWYYEHQKRENKKGRPLHPYLQAPKPRLSN